MVKLINRIPGSRLLISSLPGSALRSMLNRSASLAMSTCVLKALPGKLDIKRHSPSIPYISDLHMITEARPVQSYHAPNLSGSSY